jgi:hypothetical protein
MEYFKTSNQDLKKNLAETNKVLNKVNMPTETKNLNIISKRRGEFNQLS